MGQRLVAAQPREMAVGNIVRRVLGLVREVAEDGVDMDASTMGDTGTSTPITSEQYDPALGRPLLSNISSFSPLRHGATLPVETTSQPRVEISDGQDLERRPTLHASHVSYAAPAQPMVTSLFGLFSHPDTPSPSGTPLGPQSPVSKPVSDLLADSIKKEDLKAEVLEGIRELLDELDQADEQIAQYALDHIHSNEIILTHTSSTTVQTFLLAAAKKRKFTVVHAEAHPNDHHDTHATVLTGRKRYEAEPDPEDGQKWKKLTDAGITVVLIPDSAVFAMMSRVNKVILATHTVLANGGLVAAVGARNIAEAAKMHQTPVVVVSGVYKLSPVYPFNPEELIEYGDAGNVIGYQDGAFVDKMEVVNPLFDYVPADLVDLYITNLGGHAPSYLYRIVADHYRAEDLTL